MNWQLGLASLKLLDEAVNVRPAFKHDLVFGRIGGGCVKEWSLRINERLATDPHVLKAHASHPNVVLSEGNGAFTSSLMCHCRVMCKFC